MEAWDAADAGIGDGVSTSLMLSLDKALEIRDSALQVPLTSPSYSLSCMALHRKHADADTRRGTRISVHGDSVGSLIGSACIYRGGGGTEARDLQNHVKALVNEHAGKVMALSEQMQSVMESRGEGGVKSTAGLALSIVQGAVKEQLANPERVAKEMHKRMIKNLTKQVGLARLH